MTNPVSLGTTSQATAQGGFIQVTVNGISVTAIAQTQIFPGQVTVWNENGVWKARTGVIAVATASKSTIRRREPVAPPPVIAIITPFKAAIVRFDNLQVFKSADGANVFILATVSDIEQDNVWLHNTGTDREQYLAFAFRGEDLTIRGDISEALEGWASGYFGQNYTNRGYDAVHHSVMVRTFEPSFPFNFYSSLFLEKETYLPEREFTLPLTLDFNGPDPITPQQITRETREEFLMEANTTIHPEPNPVDLPGTTQNELEGFVRQFGSWRPLENVGRPASNEAVGNTAIASDNFGAPFFGSARELTVGYLDVRYAQNAEYVERRNESYFENVGGCGFNALVDEETGAFEFYVNTGSSYRDIRRETDEIAWNERLSSGITVPNRMYFFHNRRREASLDPVQFPEGTPDTPLFADVELDIFNINFEIDIESLLLGGNGWYITRSGSFRYDIESDGGSAVSPEPNVQLGILPSGTTPLLNNQQVNYDMLGDCPKVRTEADLIRNGSVGYRASPFSRRSQRYPEPSPPIWKRVISTGIAEDYLNIKLDDVIDTYTLYQGGSQLSLSTQSFYIEFSDRNEELDALIVGSSLVVDLTLTTTKRTMGRSEYLTEKFNTLTAFTINDTVNRVNTVARDDTEFNSFWAFTANAEVDIYWRSLNGFYQLAKGTVTLFEFTDTPTDNDRYAPYTRRNPVAITISITELVEGENPMIVSAQYSDRAGIVSSDNYFCLLKHECDRSSGNYFNSYLEDNTPTISICRVPTDSQAQTEREETATILKLVGDKWQRQEPVRGTATAFNGSGSSKSLSYYPN